MPTAKRRVLTAAAPLPNAVSLGDVLLREADIDLLKGPFWLSDEILAFYFEYASIDKYKDLEPYVLLLPGAMSFLLANCQGQSEVTILLEPLHVQQKELVLFAVNDNPDVGAAGGGTHWSLLVYCKRAGSFRHYDSSTGRSSRLAATRLYRAVQEALAPGCACSLVHVDSMPQQENGYDCGVYVLAVADAICSWARQTWARQVSLRSSSNSEEVALNLERKERQLGSLLTSDKVTLFRRKLLDLVTVMQRNGRGVVV